LTPSGELGSIAMVLHTPPRRWRWHNTHTPTGKCFERFTFYGYLCCAYSSQCMYNWQRTAGLCIHVSWIIMDIKPVDGEGI
jgi:hypothetical protein